MAEREGFEPSVGFNAYAGLANLCLQPLGHRSLIISIFTTLAGICQSPASGMSCNALLISKISSSCCTTLGSMS